MGDVGEASGVAPVAESSERGLLDEADDIFGVGFLARRTGIGKGWPLFGEMDGNLKSDSGLTSKTAFIDVCSREVCSRNIDRSKVTHSAGCS
jgi:hypothetical protein